MADARSTAKGEIRRRLEGLSRWNQFVKWREWLRTLGYAAGTAWDQAMRDWEGVRGVGDCPVFRPDGRWSPPAVMGMALAGRLPEPPAGLVGDGTGVGGVMMTGTGGVTIAVGGDGDAVWGEGGGVDGDGDVAGDLTGIEYDHAVRWVFEHLDVRDTDLGPVPSRGTLSLLRFAQFSAENRATFFQMWLKVEADRKKAEEARRLAEERAAQAAEKAEVEGPDRVEDDGRDLVGLLRSVMGDGQDEVHVCGSPLSSIPVIPGG